MIIPEYTKMSTNYCEFTSELIAKWLNVPGIDIAKHIKMASPFDTNDIIGDQMSPSELKNVVNISFALIMGSMAAAVELRPSLATAELESHKAMMKESRSILVRNLGNLI